MEEKEKKIATALLEWFRTNFEPDTQFKDILSDDEFKYLDIDVLLWRYVRPKMQDLVEHYLRSYKDGLWDGSAALRYVSCKNKECDDFGKEEEEREVVIEKERFCKYFSRTDIPDEIDERWSWTCPTCGLSSDFGRYYYCD